MKLLFISNLFPDESESYRGLDNATLLHYLSKQVEIEVLCARPALPFSAKWQQAYKPRAVDEKFQPVYVPVPYLPKAGGLVNHHLYRQAMQKPLEDLQQRFAFNAIFCAWAYPDACGMAPLAEKLKVPMVVITQGTDVHTYLGMAARRKAIVASLSRVKGVVNRSRDLARRLAEAGVPEKKLHVVYNGVDTSLFYPVEAVDAKTKLGLPLNERVLLFVGNFLPVKNQELLLGAFAGLAQQKDHQNIRLVMVGGGPLEAEIRQLAKDLGVETKITFAGRKTPSEVAIYMQASELLVLSSHNEGVPNVVLEAFASGRPVVTTDVGGIHEVLKEDYLGCLTKPGDKVALVAALSRVLNRPNETERIAKYGSSFSWDKVASAYLSVIEQNR